MSDTNTNKTPQLEPIVIEGEVKPLTELIVPDNLHQPMTIIPAELPNDQKTK